ncbi:5337_t:CDS:1, partial [Racocetra persica]
QYALFMPANNNLTTVILPSQLSFKEHHTDSIKEKITTKEGPRTKKAKHQRQEIGAAKENNNNDSNGFSDSEFNNDEFSNKISNVVKDHNMKANSL